MISTKEIHQNIFCTVIRKPDILRKALKARYISAMGIAHRNISDWSTFDETCHDL
jgi:hypothetical protein